MQAAETASLALTPDDALSKAFSKVHHAASPQSSMRLPEDVGAGSYTQIQLRGGMSLSIVDVAFARPVTLSGIAPPDDQYSLMFCLGGSMHWHSLENGNEYAVQEEQSCFMDAGKASGRSFFPEGGGINSLGVTMPGEALRGLFGSTAAGNAGGLICRTLQKDARLRTGKTDVKHKRIIHDILSCRLSGTVRHIFLESKVMELLAVSFDEFFFENTEIGSAQDMDAQVVDRLKRAKEILDADIANAPTLAYLARMVSLNEYKLKTGFKKLFGMPVHAYVIDRRLEEARYLLETKRLRVTQAAQLVGYSELGQFAGKFRRKFGVSPSELLRAS